MPLENSVLNPSGFWTDERMASCGFMGGLTKRSSGDIKNDLLSRKRFLDGPKLKGKKAFFLNQVHGTRILKAGIETPEEPALEGDGWICDEPGIIPCVLVADCLPIFIWNKLGQFFGVFHAGWKGLAAGFARLAALEMKKEFGLSGENLLASVGPHIGACCCVMGPEIKKFFPAEDFAFENGELRLDLNREAKNQLLDAGIAHSSIYLSPECTVCSGDYFSYRNGEAERLAAFVTILEGKL